MSASPSRITANAFLHEQQPSPLPVEQRISVLIVGHGSRDDRANEEFRRLVESYRDSRPGFQVSHGYIELATPSLASALSEAAKRSAGVIVVPLFLFGAGHLKNDIPIALATARREHPAVQFVATRELGVHPALIGLAFDRVNSIVTSLKVNKKTSVIVVGRGASDPDANGDFCKLVRLLSEGRSFSWVLPSFIGITKPTFEETAELLSRSRPERIVVVPYFLFGGRLMSKLEEQVERFAAQHPWIEMRLATYLGPDDTVVRVLHERVLQAVRGEPALPCDTCQYRQAISGITDNVGGLQALLWSVRHSFTHTQAAPHTHAHRPLRKHVLVCGNVDCAERGSVALINKLRGILAACGHERDMRVTRTSCMGRCGEGPTVAVYPDGIWYRNVKEDDAEEIVNDHLLNDRLVGRLLDNIMM